ncbi:MAG: hypothetical protein GY939_23260, partial [Actinomycetia bacterium]|nr:hypothetical protein [Actinomycetes bacterium]
MVPTPDQVRLLIEAAQESRRPEYARCFIITSTTGVRRGEVVGLRFSDLDDHGVLTIRTGITQLRGRPMIEGTTKNRRLRSLAVGPKTLGLIQAQRTMMSERAAECDVELAGDAFIFSDAIDGSAPWKPDAVTQYIGRLQTRANAPTEIKFRLRKFMETCGHDLGFSLGGPASWSRSSRGRPLLHGPGGRVRPCSC